MRRFLLVVVLSALAISATAFAQSSNDSKPLGDVARATRNTSKKSSTRVYDDDNFPKSKPAPTAEAKSKPKAPRVVEYDEDGNPTISEDDSKPEAEAEAKGAKAEDASGPKADGEDRTAKTETSKAEISSQWKTKVDAQRGQIEMLEREMAVQEKEYKLRASSYYSDAGTRLRDEKKWAEDDRKYAAEMDARKQKLDKAKEELDKMLEDARHAGVSGLD